MSTLDQEQAAAEAEQHVNDVVCLFLLATSAATVKAGQARPGEVRVNLNKTVE